MSILLPLVAVHIASGTFGLIAGTVAMARRKGGPQHARWGSWFFIAMLVMAVTATPLALLEPDRLSAVAAVLTAYLVTTSWMAVKRRGKAGWPEWAALAAAIGCVVAEILLGLKAMNGVGSELDGQPATAFFVFAGLAAWAALLDLRVLLGAPLSAQQRLARHLWRMCTAYFLAATSLFLGQQDDVFPFMAGSPLLFIPSLATLIFIAWWQVKVRRKPKPRRAIPATQTP